MDAYLDIETTGLSPYMDKITVVGVSVGESERVVQWVGDSISAARILKFLERTTTLYTYNGARFDLRFLRNHLGIDLEKRFRHRDLMFDCWSNNLYGGLKAVERRLGVCRKVVGVDGLEAIRLWRQFETYGDRGSLRKLLEYNREDVLNLREIKKILL